MRATASTENLRSPAMREFLARAAAFVAALVFPFMPLEPARARMGHDGMWSVLVVTDSGTCNAFSYAVRVADGRLTYAGEGPMDLSGTVDGDGIVHVKVSLGPQSASGNGRLSADTGTGTWRGQSPGGSCSGRWTAERKS
jgi:hypothetical protein